jgi:5-methylcytosine-specific restriction endonuclease McrA
MRPILAKRETKNDEASQRRAVLARDKNVCQFERRIEVPVDLRFGGGGFTWVPCGSKEASDTAHLIRRPHLSPKARFHPDLAIRACRRCHDAFDGYSEDVRAPYDMAVQAWNTAVELSKVPPPIRYDPRTDARYADRRHH